MILSFPKVPKSSIMIYKPYNIRLMKIILNGESEELTLDCSRDVHGDWQHDYNKYMIGLVDPKLPCYIFYRLDERDHTHAAHFLWIFLTWSPDLASVKHKMLYAATKSTLKMEFGSGDHIKDELFCTSREDITLEGYLKHLNAQLEPKPMTMREEELELIKQSEHLERINVDSKQKTLQGVMFPIDEMAQRNLDKFQSKIINYLQLFIDIPNEKILSGIRILKYISCLMYFIMAITKRRNSGDGNRNIPAEFRP